MNQVCLYIIVEGVTEEQFVKRGLQRELNPNALLVHPLLLGLSRKRHRKGGRVSIGRLCNHAVRQLKQHPGCYCSTLVDTYALGHGFEKLSGDSRQDIERYASHIEEQIARQVTAALGSDFDRRRLIPYVQMHEFEALLFSDPRSLAQGMGVPGCEADLAGIVEASGGPERIDDDPQTAPSKRILGLQPRYEKVHQGIQVALDIGLEPIRRACPRFDAWVGKLMALRPLS